MAPTRYLTDDQASLLNKCIGYFRFRRLLEQRTWDKNIAVFIQAYDYEDLWWDWLYEQVRLDSEGALLELIQCRPEVCLESVFVYDTGSEDNHLLWWLCYETGETFDKVIDLVAKLYPSEIVRPECIDTGLTGNTCLHVTAERACRSSDARLRILLRHCTDPAAAVMMQNDKEETVLHTAVKGSACLSALQTIVATNPQVLHSRPPPRFHYLWNAYSNTESGRSTLASILENASVSEPNDVLFQQFWAKVQYLALQFFSRSERAPASVSLDPSSTSPIFVLHGLLLDWQPSLPLVQFCSRYRPDTASATDMSGNMPLHVLMASHRYWKNGEEAVTAVQALVQAAPSAVRIPDQDGAIPLQLAIRNRVPTKIIEALLAAAPETIFTSDASGNLPLHLAVVSAHFFSEKHDIDLVAPLVREAPSAALIPNQKGSIPLHLAIQNKAPVPMEIVEILLEAAPETIFTSDASGNLPLHLAVVTTGSHWYVKNKFDFVAALVRAAPSAVRIPNQKGSIPLHLAVQTKLPTEIVELLLEAAPETIALRDAVHGLYPFQLAASVERGCISVHSEITEINMIYFLLRKQPDLLSEKME